ncbi:MAG: TMEM165/GDT1 family protein [Segniliparus sp.]|uniref:TMEM165/GDT1 family protein n=1 Tax=Segniliparus sp. TaxID=2804064 RepID=UPI003F37D039
MREILEAFLLSFGVVFLAELGDKSQLLALLFATRMRPWLVVVGITVASGVVHLVSVGAGRYVGDALDPRLTTVFAGAALIGCGLWGLRERFAAGEGAMEISAAPPGRLASIATVVSAFLLAELGDKTMFATVALGARHSFLGVWLGSTAGMVAADALAIVLGLGLAKRIPYGKLMAWANVMFLALGGWFLADGLWQFAPALALALVAVLIVGGIALFWLFRRRNRELLGSHR